MRRADALLEIDESRVADAIEKHIRDLLDQCSARGILIGLSGGLDSAVLATLAVRAVGKELVHVSYLYDRDSEKESEQKAGLTADWLGLELEVQNIEPEMHRRRIHGPQIMRLGGFCGSVGRRIAHNWYRLMFAESPFVSTLRQGKFNGHTLKESIFDHTVRHIEDGFNARHVYRREILEKRAKDKNWLLLGAANRSEFLVGWFVQGGIDDLPLSPLMGLYKTQVRQLAVYLKIPLEIRNQIPSPDMMRGITDEFTMGISYSKIDIILDSMERGLSDEEMIAAGVTRKEISLVHEMNRLSVWKRESEHDQPPVDGGVSGGLRAS